MGRAGHVSDPHTQPQGVHFPYSDGDAEDAMGAVSALSPTRRVPHRGTSRHLPDPHQPIILPPSSGVAGTGTEPLQPTLPRIKSAVKEKR